MIIISSITDFFNVMQYPVCTEWSKKWHKANDTIILQPYITE